MKIDREVMPRCPFGLQQLKLYFKIGYSGIKLKFISWYKKYGWKAVAGIFCYYLVRDVTVYIILPYMIFNKLEYHR